MPQSSCLERMEPFNDLFYLSCFYSSLFPVLKHFGRSLLPVIVNDICFYRYGGVNKPSQLSVEYLTYKNLDTVLGEEDIEVSAHTPDEVDVDAVNCAICAGKPVILWVDCYYESIRNDTYLKIHWPHTIVIYGFDNRLSRFNVIEHTKRDSLTYAGRFLSYADVMNSYKGYLANFHAVNKFPACYEFNLLKNGGMSPKDAVRYNETYLDNIRRSRDYILQGMKDLKSFINDMERVFEEEALLRSCGMSLLGQLNDVVNARLVDIYRGRQLGDSYSGMLDNLALILECWKTVRANIARYIFSSVFDRDIFKLAAAAGRDAYVLEMGHYKKLFGGICSL